jgi:5'-nucleotidase
MIQTLSAVRALAAAAILLAGCAAPMAPHDTRAPVRPTAATATVPHAASIDINLVAITDFHGHLEPSKFTHRSVKHPHEMTVQAGGIATIGGALAAWRKEDPELLLVGSGDLIGASTPISAMWADEPTLTALGDLGMRLSSVGNHEFDQGRRELLRQQYGGCDSPRPDKACKLTPRYPGARFSYLAANVLDSATGKPLFPAWQIEVVKGVRVAFIGAVLTDTARLVLPSGIAGLQFTDEADAINRAVRESRAAGATTFVVMIHEGGETEEAVDQPECTGLHGPVVGIAQRLDPDVKLILGGHTHKGYQCRVGERVIAQAEMGGHMAVRATLAVDAASGRVRDIRVKNVVLREGDYPPDPRMAGYLAEVKRRSEAALARPAARLGVASLSKEINQDGEAPLGDLVADAMLAATRAQGGQIAIMNPAGLRRDLDTGPGQQITFGQLQAVLPFSNTLVMLDMSGKELRELLEQQWLRERDEPARAMLQVSQGFSYQWDARRPKGQRIVPGSLKLDGAVVEDGKIYRVVTNNFLAEGGDSFSVFQRVKQRQDTHIRDLDALVEYLAKAERSGRPAGSLETAGRIRRVE